MNQADVPMHPLDRQPWTAKRWAGTITAVFMAQLILLYLSGSKEWKRPEIPSRGALALHLVGDSWSSRQLALWQTYRDPTLFSLPNVHSFSGNGWLKFNPMEHHFQNWQESALWLALPEPDLGESFHQYVARSASDPMRMVDKPMSPRLGVELLVPNLPMAEESSVRLLGGVAGRQLQTSARLRSWHHSDILSNTVVRVVADAVGQIFSATLTQSSGLLEADQFALHYAQTARFQPLDTSSAIPLATNGFGPSLEWGSLEFHWHTLPPQDGTEPSSAATLPLP